ncbi:MAG: DUF5675 family protein [Spirochaetaceae bacterium]
MSYLKLIRVIRQPDCTVGNLYLGNTFFCYTMERPWEHNERNVSCIPEGNYMADLIVSPSYGSTFEITGVPDRDHILFHPGNWASDSEGCVLLGRTVAASTRGLMVTDSRNTVAEFMQRMSTTVAASIQVTNVEAWRYGS